MARPDYEAACNVGCAKLKIALVLDGARGKTKTSSHPIRDAVVAECTATSPSTEMRRFEGLTPDKSPQLFRCNDRIFMLDMLYFDECIAPDQKQDTMTPVEQFDAYANVKELISEVRNG